MYMITRGRNFLFELIDRQEAWQVLDVSAQHWMEILCRHQKPLLPPLFVLGKECCYELKSGISFSFVYSFLGDCSLPPDVPNAQSTLGGLTSFPEKRTVTYKCNRGFVKVPGKADSMVCQNNKWSELAEFCNRKFFISF